MDCNFDRLILMNIIDIIPKKEGVLDAKSEQELCTQRLFLSAEQTAKPASGKSCTTATKQALGVDLATIQSLVGHADVDMTKHYLHVQDPVRQSAIAKFENAFFEKPQEVHRNIIEFVKSS